MLLDLLYRPDSIYTRASHEHVLSAAFGVVLLSMVGASLLLERERALPAIAHVGSYTPLLVGLYLVAMRSVSVHGRRQAAKLAGEATARYGALSLRAALLQRRTSARRGLRRSSVCSALRPKRLFRSALPPARSTAAP